jgi:hypothetical protein
VLGYVTKRPPKREDPRPRDLAIPADLRRRLATWLDVDEVGAEGFWLWLRAVLPLLPTPAPNGSNPGGLVTDTRPAEVRDLHQRLVVYAREHARLTVICEQYAKDNQVLARRLKALEAALRTFAIAGHEIEIPADEGAEDASERYLGARRAR